MRLTVLGCWAPYPRAGGACSGYLLEDDNTNLLLDCGNGAFSNLQKHIDFRRLHGVIITHFHPDHYMDLFCLRHAVEGAIRDGSLKDPLPLYVPGTPGPAFEQMMSLGNAFQTKKITEDALVQIGRLSFRFLRTVHKLEAYAVRATGSSTIGYTADTGWFSGLNSFFQGCNLLLSEASVLEKDKEYAKTGHLTVKQAAQLGRDTGAKKLVLSHFWPEYDLKEVLAEAKPLFQGVELAEEGAIYLG